MERACADRLPAGARLVRRQL